MAEIDHDAAIAHVRRYGSHPIYAGGAYCKYCNYVADLAERAKKLEEKLRAIYDTCVWNSDALGSEKDMEAWRRVANFVLTTLEKKPC